MHSNFQSQSGRRVSMNMMPFNGMSYPGYMPVMQPQQQPQPYGMPQMMQPAMTPTMAPTMAPAMAPAMPYQQAMPGNPYQVQGYTPQAQAPSSMMMPSPIIQLQISPMKTPRPQPPPTSNSFR